MSDVLKSAVREMTQVAGLLADTLDEAMQRLHNTHRGRGAFEPWARCQVSTLCQEAAQLAGRDDVQVALAQARADRGEGR